MPTYNYFCPNCKEQFVYFQKMSENSLSNCEKCNGEIHRIISGGTGLIFKGSGFYKTDYKQESKTTKSKEDIQDSQSKKNKSDSKDNKQLKSKKVEKKSE